MVVEDLGRGLGMWFDSPEKYDSQRGFGYCLKRQSFLRQTSLGTKQTARELEETVEDKVAGEKE